LKIQRLKQNLTSKHIPDICVAFSEKITGDEASCSWPGQRENPVVDEMKPGKRVPDKKIKTQKETSGQRPRRSLSPEQPIDRRQPHTGKDKTENKPVVPARGQA